MRLRMRRKQEEGREEGEEGVSLLLRFRCFFNPTFSLTSKGLMSVVIIPSF
jgi:hypothetical protein